MLPHCTDLLGHNEEVVAFVALRNIPVGLQIYESGKEGRNLIMFFNKHPGIKLQVVCCAFAGKYDVLIRTGPAKMHIKTPYITQCCSPYTVGTYQK